MLVQSGRPVGVMRTHEWAPRVLIANSNLVGDWATWPEFRRLEHLGLTMYGQMTAGSWIYIGTQGILQGTYETFAAVAAKRFGGTPRRHPHPHRRLRRDGRRAAARRHDERRRLPDRRRRPAAAAAPGRAPLPRRGGRRPRRRGRAGRCRPRRSAARCPSGSSATAPRCFPELLRRGVRRSTSSPTRPRAHDPLSYLPEGVDARGLARLRRGASPRSSPTGPARRWPGTSRRWSGSWTPAPRSSTTATRSATRPGSGGYDRAFDFPGFVPGLHPAAVLRGQGPVPLGRAVRRPRGHRRHRPGRARPVPRQRPPAPVDPRRAGSGSRSRGCRPGSAGSATASATRPGCGSTRWSPPARSRRRSSSAATTSTAARSPRPYRETEAMLDGSDAIADWPLLNALVNTASGATWVSIHHGGGVGIGRSHPRRPGLASPTAPTLAAAEARARAHQRPRHGRHPPRRRRLRPRARGRRGARRPHPDARGLTAPVSPAGR